MYRNALLLLFVFACEPAAIGRHVSQSQLYLQGDGVLDFGAVRLGRDGRAVLSFENTGSAALAYRLQLEDGSQFRVLRSTGILVTGEIATVDVRVFPTQGPGELTDELLVVDQVNSEQIRVSLVAVVPDDADKDGFVGSEFGGSDCDDGSALIHPDADEIWYDGIDQDCDGASDFDRDQDGVERIPEGGDCNDENSEVFPGATDVNDMLDNDCDGFVDENALNPGDVLLSEWLVSASNWSYLELENRTTRPLDLSGWVLAVNGIDWRFPKGFAMQSGEMAVLCEDEQAGATWACDAEFEGGQSLGVSGGNFALSLPGLLTVDSLRWGSIWSVDLDIGNERQGGCDSPGLSSEPSCWCQSSSVLQSGVLGTPGEPNSCSSTGF